MDALGSAPRRPDRGDRCAARSRAYGQVPLHHPQLPQPGRRHARPWSAGWRSCGSPSGPTCWWSRTTRTGCSASTATRCRRCARSNEDHVVYLGSFSKTFAPGFRVGWVLAPHAVREKLVLAQESATLCPPVFSQFAVAAYLHQSRLARPDQDLPGDVSRAPRRDDRRADRPHAGRHHLDLPARRLLRLGHPAARARLAGDAAAGRVTARVAYVPGTAFYADGFGSRHMRLSYCFPTPERIIEGTRRLGEVLDLRGRRAGDLRHRAC